MRRWMSWLTLVAAGGLAACSDQATESPAGPDFKPSPPPPTCSFNTIQQAVNDQFSGSTDTYVSGLVTDAKNLKDNNPAAADLKLYEALDTLAAQFGQGTAANASLLAFRTLLCTSGGAGGLADTSFVAAFGSSGAFAAVGYATTDNRTVVSHDTKWVLHPDAGQTWAGSSSAEPLIIYGAPVAIAEAAFTNDPPILSGNIFDWKSHPAGVSFSPDVIVGNCEPGTPGPGVVGWYVQHNAVSGAFSTDTAEILDYVAPDCSAALFRRVQLSLGQRLLKLFVPAEAHAFFFLPTSGGRKGALSPDAVVDPDAVNLVFESQPKKSGNQVGKQLLGNNNNPLSVIARSEGGTSFRQTEVFAWLEATNNQGTFVQVCNNWAKSDANGRFTFTNAFLNKAGGYNLTVKTVGTQVDNSAEGAPRVPPGQQPATALFNVKNGTISSAAACQPPNAYPGTGAIPSQDGPPPVP